MAYREDVISLVNFLQTTEKPFSEWKINTTIECYAWYAV